MAQMHSRIPVSKMQRGELLVYEAMSHLPENWVIYHSCKEDYREDGRYIHFEADFVLLIPGMGIVVAEVKDWPEMRISQGHWQSRRNADEPWKTQAQAPLEQANIALQKLMRSLARCGCISRVSQRWPEHRHLAILTRGEPESAGNHNLPFDSLYLCGATSLLHLQERIEALFTLEQPTRMTKHHVQKISEALSPSVLFRMTPQNYLQEMDMAAANILNLLPALYESTGGIRVEGCAGTGKTVIACAELARLAADLPRDGQHRLLLLCFNHSMAHELQQHPLLNGHKDVVTICTFHDFCIDNILVPNGLSHLINYTGSGDRLTETALDYINQLVPELPHYDAIFVDEAQDFRGSWWHIIKHLLTPDGKLYIFADEHQDLYGRYNQLPELSTRVRLTANLRNAQQIAGFSRTMLPADAQDFQILPLSGADINIAPPADTPEERAAEVSRIIHQLLNSSPAIQMQDIVVLSPWRTSHQRCCLNMVPELATAAADESPAAAAERRSACRKPGATKIFSSTIKSFKGQEAAYVIVTDIIGLGESRGFDMKELYTACTRARFGLHLVATTTGRKLVETFTNHSI